jgi:uncharacterized membrane protein YozB (DUF420 family)
LGLPQLNAALNAASFILLFMGWRFIKARRVAAHKACMLGAVASSALFLASYLYYHYQAGHVVYRGPARGLYLAILASHTILAVVVPPLLWRALVPALRERFDMHAPRARILLPIWMYVSITGVIVYAMVYHLQPAVSGIGR